MKKNLVLIAGIALILYWIIGLFYQSVFFFSNKPSSLEKLKSNEIEFAKMYFKNDKTKLEKLKKTVSYSLFEKTTNKDSLGIYMLSACNELDSIK